MTTPGRAKSGSVEAQLDGIAKQVASCVLCPLSKSRTNTVPGNGNPQAEIVIIGEAPGYHEDREGQPFVGDSGKLLDKLLASINLSRADVFVTNMVKCRPPQNRDPQPKEMETCRPYLEAQFAAIHPRIVITLGRFAMERYLPGARISLVHGVPRLDPQSGILYVPMFHPAAALRTPAWMDALRADFLSLQGILEQHQAGTLHAEPLPPITAPPARPVAELATTAEAESAAVAESVAAAPLAAKRGRPISRKQVAAKPAIEPDDHLYRNATPTPDLPPAPMDHTLAEEAVVSPAVAEAAVADEIAQVDEANAQALAAAVEMQEQEVALPVPTSEPAPEVAAITAPAKPKRGRPAARTQPGPGPTAAETDSQPLPAIAAEDAEPNEEQGYSPAPPAATMLAEESSDEQWAELTATTGQAEQPAKGRRGRPRKETLAASEGAPEQVTEQKEKKEKPKKEKEKEKGEDNGQLSFF